MNNNIRISCYQLFFLKSANPIQKLVLVTEVLTFITREVHRNLLLPCLPTVRLKLAFLRSPTDSREVVPLQLVQRLLLVVLLPATDPELERKEPLRALRRTKDALVVVDIALALVKGAA